MDSTLSLGAAFLIGLLGATHCIGMCGGITGALSMAIPPGPKRQNRLLATLLSYNLGRIFSYSLAGFILGAFGWLLGEQATIISTALRSFAAILLIVMGLYIAGWWKGLVFIEKLGGGLWKLIQPWSKKALPVKNLKGALLLGLIWGWLPCGLVYSTLIWSSMAGEPIFSALLMTAFGLGTLPAILTTGLLAEQASSIIQNVGFRTLSGLLLIAYGIWTLPFIHPFFQQAVQRIY